MKLEPPNLPSITHSTGVVVALDLGIRHLPTQVENDAQDPVVMTLQIFLPPTEKQDRLPGILEWIYVLAKLLSLLCCLPFPDYFPSLGNCKLLWGESIRKKQGLQILNSPYDIVNQQPIFFQSDKNMTRHY